MAAVENGQAVEQVTATAQPNGQAQEFMAPPPVKNIAIALLYFNKDNHQFEHSLARNIDVIRSAGLVATIAYYNYWGLAVDMARNKAVARALNEEKDAVIWLDTDMVYPNDALTRLVLMANAGHAIAAGMYRNGRKPHQLMVRLHDDPDEWSTVEKVRAAMEPGKNVTKCIMAAGGFSIVRTELYKAIQPPWYCNWDFVTGKGMTGEDWFFVLRAAERGVSPVVDPYLGAVHLTFWGPTPCWKGMPEMSYCLPDNWTEDQPDALSDVGY